MERPCVTCGNTFVVADPRRPARACSPSCRGRLAWAGRPRGESYTKLYLAGHPLADARGAVGEHRAVLYAKLGPGQHPCHWCGATLEWQPVGAAQRRGSIKVDHLDDNPRNNDPANLVASCNSCNIKRGKPDRIKDDELFIIQRGKRARAEPRTCALCGRPFLARPVVVKAGGGRWCSKSCAVRAFHANRSDA